MLTLYVPMAPIRTRSMCVFGLPKRASASLAFAASSTRQPSSASLRLVIRRTTAVRSTTRTVYEVATPPPRGSRGAISAWVRIDTVRVVTYVGRVVALVPFFGTLFSTLLPALFALGVSGLPKALAVLAVGVGVHLIEANVVASVAMERQVNLPPVITIAGASSSGSCSGRPGSWWRCPFSCSFWCWYGIFYWGRFTATR